MERQRSIIVGVASNCLTHKLIHTATRRVKGASNTTVQQPYIIQRYNDFMGDDDDDDVWPFVVVLLTDDARKEVVVAVAAKRSECCS